MWTFVFFLFVVEAFRADRGHRNTTAVAATAHTPRETPGRRPLPLQPIALRLAVATVTVCSGFRIDVKATERIRRLPVSLSDKKTPERNGEAKTDMLVFVGDNAATVGTPLGENVWIVSTETGTRRNQGTGGEELSLLPKVKLENIRLCSNPL